MELKTEPSTEPSTEERTEAARSVVRSPLRAPACVGARARAGLNSHVQVVKMWGSYVSSSPQRLLPWCAASGATAAEKDFMKSRGAATSIEGRINWESCHSGGTRFFPAVTTLRPGACIIFFG